jgi:hypothetical protein
MNMIFRPFREGFFGAFTLAASILIAVGAVASAFMRGELPDKPRDPQVSQH